MSTRVGRHQSLETESFINCIASLGILMLVVSCGSSDMDKYSDRMRPILQEHSSAMAIAVQSMDESYAKIIDNPSARTAIGEMRALRQLASDAEADVKKQLESWIALQPPPEAEEFHLLLVDAMAGRRNGFLMTKTQIDIVLITGTIDTQLEADTAEYFDDADRAHVRATIEGRRLGIVR